MLNKDILVISTPTSITLEDKQISTGLVFLLSSFKDKDKKIISGDAEKIKTVYDTWVFSKNERSSNPNWLLIDTTT